MPDPQTLQQAIELYDRFTHEGMDRRDFFARMTLIAGSAAAATSLMAGIAASPAAAAIVPADDPRLTTRTMTFDNPAGYKAYVAEPRTRSLKATVLVVHENRGLNDHIRDVARRIGLEGFRAVAPDFLSLSGGTPSNEDAARDAIGKLDRRALHIRTAPGCCAVERPRAGKKEQAKNGHDESREGKREDVHGRTFRWPDKDHVGKAAVRP